ncbi:MAG: hypothetical protein LVT47_06005 [Cyanobacteria bacterium LVE1205-1]
MIIKKAWLLIVFSILISASAAPTSRGGAEIWDDLTKFPTIFQWFQTPVHPANMQRPPRLQTECGNPEIVIEGVTKKQVIDQIVSSKLEKGMQIKNVNDYGVTVSKRIDDSFIASLLYGSRYDSYPEARITYNVVEQGASVKVYSRIEIITNPGSGFEKSSDVTASHATQMQSELEQLKGKFAK